MDKEKRKRIEEDEGGTVGRYLQAKRPPAPVPVPAAVAAAVGGKVSKGAVGLSSADTGAASGSMEFGMEKKKKKGGGFGDFSGW